MSDSHGMEPTEESAQTIEAFARYGESGLPEMLADMGRRVQEIVPQIWGMSVTLRDGELTFTLVSSSAEAAALDGVQYAAGGPCVDAVDEGREVRIEEIDGPMVEEEWRLFATASAAQGVRSTLSLPLTHDGSVVGGVNLYASAAEAFVGREEHLAAVFGTWASQSITNADMGFASRDRAEHGPTRVAEQSEIDVAVGIMMADQGLGPDQARARLIEAARRSGISPVSVARTIVRGLAERRRRL
jgi:GAF domain-containing protein